MAEELTEEDIIAMETELEYDQASVKDQENKISNQSQELAQQELDKIQAITDDANQQLAQLPQKIEEKLDNFEKTLKSLMNMDTSDKKNPSSPEFDLDVKLGDLKKILDPLIATISPIETVVGKVPVIGDLMSAIKDLTSDGDNGGLSKEEIKKLVPNKPEVPQSLMTKIDSTVATVQAFCMQLPMLLINVIFKMLGAIYDMFDQIVGVIGVPPPIFPFNLVKQCPTAAEKAKEFISTAPMQIKDIAMGALKEKFAAAQALATPKLPEPNTEQLKKAEKIKENVGNTGGEQAPEIEKQPPIQSPVVSTPPTPVVETQVKSDMTWDQVKDKWKKIFHDELNYKEDDIVKIIDHYKEIYDGSNTRLDEWTLSKGMFEDSYVFIGSIRRKAYTPNNCDNSLNSMYKNNKVYDRKIEDATTIKGNIASGYKSIIGDQIVICTLIEPESSFLGLF